MSNSAGSMAEILSEEASSGTLCGTAVSPVSDVASGKEGCPPPLNWRQVLTSIQQHSLTLDFPRDHCTIRVHALGEGKPLYLLGGLTDTFPNFVLLAWLLQREYSLIIPETLVSSADFGSWTTSIPAEARRFVSLIDELGHEKPAIFAQGFGTAVALEAAIMSSGSIGCLMLQSPADKGTLTPAERLLAWGVQKSSRTLSCWPGWNYWVRSVHGRWFPPLDSTRTDFFSQNAGEVVTAVVARRALALQKWSLAGRESLVNDPVLIIGTEGEGFQTTQCRERLEKRLPKVSAHWLHTTGRLTALTHPHRLAKLIQQFLGEVNYSETPGKTTV